MNKFRQSPVFSRYIGVDVAIESLKHLSDRFNNTIAKSAASPVQARVVAADLGGTVLEEQGVLVPEERFDIVSIQFALHYMFNEKVSESVVAVSNNH